MEGAQQSIHAKILDSPGYTSSHQLDGEKTETAYILESRGRKVETLSRRSNNSRQSNSIRAIRKPPDKTKTMVVKMSWQLKTREPEDVVIQKAEAILRDWTKDAKFRAEHGVGEDIIERLPTVHFAYDAQELNFRSFLPGADSCIKARVHRVIAFDLLRPLYTITDVKDFMKAFRDIFQVLHFLWQKGIGHRDISVENLMCRISDDGELICGVLNDWDLAKLAEKKENESQFRTGIRAFLAVELHEKNPPPHIERFDWESMFYALVWIATRYEKEEETDITKLSNWLNPDEETASNAKYTYITGPHRRPPLTSKFNILHLIWIHPLSLVFQNGITVRGTAYVARKYDPNVEEPDLETLGGSVTYDKLWDVLKQDC